MARLFLKRRVVCKLCNAKQRKMQIMGLKKRYGIHLKLSQKLMQMIARGDAQSQSWFFWHRWVIYAWQASHTQELSTISGQDLNSLLSHFLQFLRNLLHEPEYDWLGWVSAQRALRHLGQNMRMEDSIVIKNNLTCGRHSEQMRCCLGQQNKGAAATLKQTGHSSFFFIHLIWSLRCSSRLPGSTFFSPEGKGGG